MKLMLDHQEFKVKPTVEETKQISKRIVHCQVDLTPEQLANEIIKGKTFVPALLSKKANGQIRKAKECWTSQEIMCLDFDNTALIDNPDYPHKSKTKKISVKHITMTIEDALREFKDTAMFLYTSFNHSDDHPKFRVVFAFKEIITQTAIIESTLEYYKKKYPNADSKCFERARMFYGGKELYVINYSNRIPCFISKKRTSGGFCDYDSIKVLSNLSQTQKPPVPPIQVSRIPDNIIAIKNLDKIRLKEYLNRRVKVFGTYAETTDYLKQQDIGELLGLSPNDYCPFHADNTKSASIYLNSKTNHYLFHCHSDKCDFGTGTITKVIEKLTGLNKVQANRFLREIYNIKFEQTEWQKEQLEIIDENIRYLHSGDMEFEYPKQYKIIKRYIPDLIPFLTMSKEYLPPEHYSEDQSKVLFFTSINRFAKFLGKSEGSSKRIGDKLAMFAYFSYIHKLKESEIPEELLRKVKFELVNQKHKSGRPTYNMVNVYEIPSLSSDTLDFAEEKAEEFKNNHLTMRGWSWENIVRVFGEEEANRVYPQMSHRKIKEKSHALTREIENVVMDLINKKGWATENEVVKLLETYIKDATKTQIQRQIKVIIGELIQKYELERIRSSVKVFESLGVSPPLSEKGYMSFPYLLVRSDKVNL